jgi:hypothetical protein
VHHKTELQPGLGRTWMARIPALLRSAAVTLLAALLLHLPPSTATAASAGASLIFVTSDDSNDVVSLLRSEPGAASHARSARSADAALQEAVTGDTIFFLADDYPHTQLAAPSDEFWRQAAAKGAKVFLEFPAELPRNATPRTTPVGPRLADGLPCLPRPAATSPGMAVNFTYTSHDRSLCAAASCTGGEVETFFYGRHCGVRDQLVWDTMATPHSTLPPGACMWNCSRAPEYCGTGCGIAPVDGGVNNCGAPNACFEPPFLSSSFRQDRLGTNTGKVEKKMRLLQERILRSISQ